MKCWRNVQNIDNKFFNLKVGKLISTQVRKKTVKSLSSSIKHSSRKNKTFFFDKKSRSEKNPHRLDFFKPSEVVSRLLFNTFGCLFQTKKENILSYKETFPRTNYFFLCLCNFDNLGFFTGFLWWLGFVFVLCVCVCNTVGFKSGSWLCYVSMIKPE